MKTMLMAEVVRSPCMNTQEPCETFLLDSPYQAGFIQLAYVDLDRAIVGMAVPTDRPLVLPTYPELRASYFTERRELGALNIGGPSIVNVANTSLPLDNLDLIYIGRGNADIRFESKSAQTPATVDLPSHPAHHAFPVRVVGKDQAQPIENRVDDLMKRMTLKEKIGHINLPCGYVDNPGKTPQEKMEAGRKFAAGTYTTTV